MSNVLQFLRFEFNQFDIYIFFVLRLSAAGIETASVLINTALSDFDAFDCPDEGYIVLARNADPTIDNQLSLTLDEWLSNLFF